MCKDSVSKSKATGAVLPPKRKVYGALPHMRCRHCASTRALLGNAVRAVPGDAAMAWVTAPFALRTCAADNGGHSKLQPSRSGYQRIAAAAKYQ